MSLSLMLVLIGLSLMILLPLVIAVPLLFPLVLLYAYASVKAAQAQRRPPATGREAMVGGLAVVESAQGPEALVRYRGERWRAVSDRPLEPGQEVMIESVHGLTVWVVPITTADGRPLSARQP